MTLTPAKEGEETDWAGVFTVFLTQTNLSYEEILDRTVVQITGLQNQLLKMREPKEAQPLPAESKQPTLSQIDEFCRLFGR